VSPCYTLKPGAQAGHTQARRVCLFSQRKQSVNPVIHAATVSASVLGVVTASGKGFCGLSVMTITLEAQLLKPAFPYVVRTLHKIGPLASSRFIASGSQR